MPGANEGGGTITVRILKQLDTQENQRATGAANLTGAIRGSNGTTAADSFKC